MGLGEDDGVDEGEELVELDDEGPLELDGVFVEELVTVELFVIVADGVPVLELKPVPDAVGVGV